MAAIGITAAPAQDPSLAEGPHIGVISPYKSQVLLIRARVAALLADYAENVDVNTIDGFQGREKAVIIFSAVRSQAKGPRSKIGFVADERRINVGLTRARSALILVGQRHALVKEPHWRAFIRLNSERGCAPACTALLAGSPLIVHPGPAGMTLHRSVCCITLRHWQSDKYCAHWQRCDFRDGPEKYTAGPP